MKGRILYGDANPPRAWRGTEGGTGRVVLQTGGGTRFYLSVMAFGRRFRFHR